MKRNVAIIFAVNALTLLAGVVTSLLGAWALGAEGRGDLAVVVLWPNVCALVAGLGLPQAHRYFMARRPEALPLLFSNALCFAAVVGLAALGLAELAVPHLVGERSPEVMRLVRLYLLNIPLALLFDLMSGLLEGARRFGWVGAARAAFFGTQALAYALLWLAGRLTVESAALTMMGAQFGATSLALGAVVFALRPRWRPGWKGWREVIGYGLRYHPGVLTAFTALRLDQLMLGGMAASAAIGLYTVAVRLSEMTTVLASSVADVLMPEVAAKEKPEDAVRLLARSLRLTLYAYALVLAPLFIAAPLILRFAYGPEFLAATGTLRLLLAASLVWGVASLVNSGLTGLGRPGLTTVSRLAAAAVTVVTLVAWLPSRGIVGAALSSLAGYSVMLAVALFWLAREQRVGLWECLRPRRDDIPLGKIKALVRPGQLRAQGGEV
jgi:O-antigen/teichoic acid export membrane protein